MKDVGSFDTRMCGIAGYSLSPRSRVDRTLAGQALLAGIAERGDDAVGYAYRVPGHQIAVHKQQTGASALIDGLSLPAGTASALVHVRDFTKGHPTIDANNHPIRHGAVVGIHNGVITNDDELFARHGVERAEPEMTVDSEIIFALAEASRSAPAALEQLHGTMAAAWLDERDPDTLWLARGILRPLWVGRARDAVFFASTRDALLLVERTLRLSLRPREVREGRLLRLAGGRVASESRWRPDRSYRETESLPAVRSPSEGAFCRERLAVLAAYTR